ncbi:MAG TPA: DUF1700 domain-containing protein [Caulobacteraceae bacterium]|nr:DUF1700 domain-containing protein [Caulobacteraceae bacterium]
MNRQDFITRLRAGLRGLPPPAIAEAVADYEAHFAEARAAGRGEDEVAAALGDPDRLARELRAEAGLKRWEAERNPSAAASAVFAVLGLGAIDILILLPILLWIGGTLLALFIAAVAGFGVGAVMMVAGPFAVHAAPVAALILAGLGLMAGAASLGAVAAIGAIGFTNALVWYGRLHLRLLRPALEPAAFAPGEITA